MNTKITDALIWTVIILSLIAGIFILVLGFRAFSSATTLIVIKEPKPGIECATMVTGDGAAIDCWEVKIENTNKRG